MEQNKISVAGLWMNLNDIAKFCPKKSLNDRVIGL